MYLKLLTVLLFCVIIGCSKTRDIIVSNKEWKHVTDVYTLGEIEESELLPNNCKLISHRSELEYSYRYDPFEGKFDWGWESVTYYKYQPWLLKKRYTASGANNPHNPKIDTFNEEIKLTSTRLYKIFSNELENPIICEFEHWNNINIGDAINIIFYNDKLKSFSKIQSETVESYNF